MITTYRLHITGKKTCLEAANNKIIRKSHHVVIRSPLMCCNHNKDNMVRGCDDLADRASQFKVG